jgi:sugar phosphate isomerase/epimerase
MKLGFDIYSLRYQPWTVFQHLDYAYQLGVDLVHLSDLSPFERLDDDYLAQVKEHSDNLGLSIEVGMLSICPTSTLFAEERGSAVAQLREMLHIAEVLGSPIVRCVLGSAADRTGPIPFEAHIQGVVETCRAVRHWALEAAVKIAIENHAGDMQAWELKALIEQAGPDYVGACIDTGNGLWVAERPFVTLEHLAPYALTSHIRDSAVWAHPAGAAVQWVAMGEGTVGIDAWAEMFREQCPQASFTLEIITGWPAHIVNYLEPSFWEAYPHTPLAEFARFLKLVDAGQPFLGPMMTVGWDAEDLPVEYRAALALQQRLDLERSVRYCRDMLGF